MWTWVACAALLHTVWGVLMVWADPARISTTAWFYDHGGNELWGVTMLAASGLAWLGLAITNGRRPVLGLAFVIPQQMLLLITAASFLDFAFFGYYSTILGDFSPIIPVIHLGLPGLLIAVFHTYALVQKPGWRRLWFMISRARQRQPEE